VTQLEEQESDCLYKINLGLYRNQQSNSTAKNMVMLIPRDSWPPSHLQSAVSLLLICIWMCVYVNFVGLSLEAVVKNILRGTDLHMLSMITQLAFLPRHHLPFSPDYKWR
jgi:hypothetical protein